MSVKNCIKYYVSNLLKLSYLQRKRISEPFQTINCTQQPYFFYKNNFIRTKSIDFGQKNLKQNKNKARLVVPQNIRTNCLG